MTIRKRLARSNLIMILIPVAIAAALLLAGGAPAGAGAASETDGAARWSLRARYA